MTDNCWIIVKSRICDNDRQSVKKPVRTIDVVLLVCCALRKTRYREMDRRFYSLGSYDAQ
jgi:hypothetical protein